ncbi:hypothetical protein ACTJIJ_14990 [Niabella sp. 22666]|uniref:hypothetical protein n=1 Tax=Niabella sp. 22666 TaxID=3453954 RepID=UPI003F86F51A
MTTHENPLNDIFSGYDDSIFSDGSIDPLGLRIIWTFIGNKIFKSKLNTISTNSYLFTINLFHHTVIQHCIAENPAAVAKIIGKDEYLNTSDLIEGLVIFLENLLIHVSVKYPGSHVVIPGTNKLNNLVNAGGKAEVTRMVKVSKNNVDGILVRQYLLGIHGRHKGPFTEMGILSTRGDALYANEQLWKDARQLFDLDKWKQLKLTLCELITKKILDAPKMVRGKICYPLDEVLTQQVTEAYAGILDATAYTSVTFKQFWLTRLGLREGISGLLYTEYCNALSDSPYDFDPEAILKAAYQSAGAALELKMIYEVEPLLTMFQKCTSRILGHKLPRLDEELSNFLDYWLDNNDVKPAAIKEILLTGNFDNNEARLRLEKLLTIYESCVEGDSRAGRFFKQLLQYHKKLMEDRGNMSWVTLGVDDSISIHRPLHLNESALEQLKGKAWVNEYYLPTINSLHKGLGL